MPGIDRRPRIDVSRLRIILRACGMTWILCANRAREHAGLFIGVRIGILLSLYSVRVLPIRLLNYKLRFRGTADKSPWLADTVRGIDVSRISASPLSFPVTIKDRFLSCISRLNVNVSFNSVLTIYLILLYCYWKNSTWKSLKLKVEMTCDNFVAVGRYTLCIHPEHKSALNDTWKKIA